MTKKEIKARIDAGWDFFPDRVTFRKDGSVEFRRAYFYRAGKSAQDFAAQVHKVFPEAKEVIADDKFASWPKTSYFVATVRF